MCAAHSVRLNFSAPRYAECGIRVGDRVLIGGLYPGSVKYVGNLDVPHSNAEVYVGARLDDPVGGSDGIWYGKRFFRCTRDHGIFVPIHKVHLLMSRRTFRSNAKSFSSDVVEFGQNKRHEEKEFPTKTQQKYSLPKPRESEGTLVTPITQETNESVPYDDLQSPKNDMQKECNNYTLSNVGNNGGETSGIQDDLKNQGSNPKDKVPNSETSATVLPKIIAKNRAGRDVLESSIPHQQLQNDCVPVPTGKKRMNCCGSSLPALTSTNPRSCLKRERHEEHFVLPGLSLPIASKCRERNVRRCRCCSTAQQAIAQRLRQEICSTYKNSANTESSPQVACISEEYLNIKLKILLRKLYSKPLENLMYSLPQIIPEDVTDWRSPHHEVEPMYFTENCQPRSKTSSYPSLPRSGKVQGGRMSGANLLPTSVSSSMSKHTSNNLTYKTAMGAGRLKCSNLSKVRLVATNEGDSDLTSRMTSLLRLKEDLSQLNTLNEYAEEELKQSLANIDSLSGITVQKVMGELLKDLKNYDLTAPKEETSFHGL